MDPMIDKTSPEFNRMTVSNFRFLDAATMSALAQDLRLSCTSPSLFFIQHHYRTRENREPTVGELRFLDAWLSLHAKAPGARRILQVQAAPAQLAAWQDLTKKRSTLLDAEPPTLLDAMDTLPRYLARSGILPQQEALYCGSAEELAVRCRKSAPSLALELPDAAAALIEHPYHPTVPRQAALLLMSPSTNAPFADEIARLLSLPQLSRTVPLALTHGEGILPHLIPLSGIALDTETLPDFDTARGPAALCEAGCHSLLLAAPEQDVPALLGAGYPLRLIGFIAPTGRIQLRSGTQSTLSLELSLLRSLMHTHTAALTLKEQISDPVLPVFTQNRDTLLGGFTCCGSVERAVLSLTGAAWQRGANIAKATLCAMLTLPLEDPASLAPALSLVLDYHRAAAELTLPALHHRILCVKEGSPKLSVFLTAPMGMTRTEELPADFQTARRLFYGG